MSTAGRDGAVGARLRAMALPGEPRRARVRSYEWLRRSRWRLTGSLGARLSAMGLPGMPCRARVRSYGWL
ncbi:ribosomal protein L37E [Xanthomonas arboricola]|nr:ribosomal protein L37E [Xanthomonas arboricola]